MPRAPALVASPVRAVWLEPEGAPETLSAHRGGGARARPPAACRSRAGDLAAAGRRRAALPQLRPAGAVRLRAPGAILPADAERPRRRRRSAPPRDAGARGGDAVRRGTGALLAELARMEDPGGAAADLASDAAEAGWLWGPFVLAALGMAERRDRPAGPASRSGTGCRSGPNSRRNRSPPTARSSPRRPAAGSRPCWDPHAEDRPGQADYASAAAGAFQPRERAGEPHMVVAEAGTGVGKTLGYLAPGKPLGGGERGAGLGLDLYPQPPAPDRRRARPADPGAGRQTPPGRAAQGPGELSLPAQPGGSGADGAPHAERDRAAGACRALGGRDPRRRHDRRRLPLLAPGPRRGGAHTRARRPAGRVPLFRLRPLPALLHRVGHQARAPGGPRDRQPCARHGAGGAGRARRFLAADPLCVR